MISNFVLQQQILVLKKERDIYVAEKLRLCLLIKEFKIDKNKAYKINIGKPVFGVSEDVKLKRKEYTVAIMQNDEKLKDVNNKIRELNRKEDASVNQFLVHIFKEMFTKDQMGIIIKEAQSRASGNPAAPVGINLQRNDEYKEKYYTYRNLIKEQIEKMIQFRIVLTRLIDSGCQQFGNGEFLKFISPLNQLVIPIKELEKIKRDHLL